MRDSITIKGLKFTAVINSEYDFTIYTRLDYDNGVTTYETDLVLDENRFILSIDKVIRLEDIPSNIICGVTINNYKLLREVLRGNCRYVNGEVKLIDRGNQLNIPYECN